MTSRKDFDVFPISSTNTITPLETSVGAATGSRHIGNNIERFEYEDDHSNDHNENNLLFDNEENEDDFPEGGLRAWKVVFGSWCASVATFGILNTAGSFQPWLATHQLAAHSDSELSWLFGINNFLFFVGGLLVGPIFDTYGLKMVTIPGYIGISAALIILSFAQKYWQIMLGYSILNGISASMVFTPSVTVVGHWFLKRRGMATGLACTGGAVGGVVFPLSFNYLTSEIGFGWTVRVLALIVSLLNSCAFIFMEARVEKQSDTLEEIEGGKSKRPKIEVDFAAFKTPKFALTVAATFMIEWAFFIPVTYLTSSALAGEINKNLAYQLLPILNAGSIVGRGLPGYLGDRYGRFNVMILTTMLSGIAIFALWLPASGASNSSANAGLMVAFAVLFGIFSGTGISMTPVCVSQVCHTKDYGKRYGTCYFMVSFGALTGVPIAGQLLTAMGGGYLGVQIFAALAYIIGSALFLCTRVLIAGMSLKRIY